MTSAAENTVPRVSVVVPAHNPGEYLRPALQSVLEQEFTDWDLLVVDDGSSEDLSWVDDLDPRIRIQRVPNRGVAVARNLGVQLTSGELVAFLDQDDIWAPTKLRRQLDLMGTGVDYCHTGFDLIDAVGARSGPGYGRAVSHQQMLAGELGVLLSSILVRRDALIVAGLFDARLYIQQDLDLFLALARLGRGSYVDSDEVHYRLHQSNGSRDYWQAIQELLGLYRSEELLARRNNNRDALAALPRGRRAVRRTYAYQAVDASRASLAERHFARAALHLARAGYLAPSVAGRSVGDKLSAVVR